MEIRRIDAAKNSGGDFYNESNDFIEHGSFSPLK
jgi:hypothetical protein